MKVIRVSRYGLSACPQCGQHIEITKDINEIDCIFCGGSFAVEFQNQPANSKSWTQLLIKGGRASIIAASFMGITGLTACDDPEPEPDNSDMTNDMPIQINPYGIPPDQDVVVGNLYGVPAEDMTAEDAGAEMGADMGADIAPAEDVVGGNLYGVPAGDMGTD